MNLTDNTYLGAELRCYVRALAERNTKIWFASREAIYRELMKQWRKQ